jgi:hypothetical protein
VNTAPPKKTGNKIIFGRPERVASTRFLFIEIITGLCAISFLVYTLRSMLVLHETTFIHDHLYWGYPVFQFFAENIIHGHFPLWNPFTHGGEPFYPIVVHLRLLEPITLLTIYLGNYLGNNDLVSLYNWAHFLQNIVMVFGIYMLFRTIAENVFIRISLIPILLYFSFMFGPFRQAAGIYQFLWVPYITYFLLRITYHMDYRWHNWLILAALIGVNWQSYYSSGIWVFFLFFLLGLLLFRRDLLRALFKSDRVLLKFAVAFVIILTTMLPNIIVMLEKDRYVFPARMIEPGYEERQPQGQPQQSEGSSLPENHGILMPYRLIIHTGTFSSIWDFIQIVYPERNRFISGPSAKSAWGAPSEAYLYVGLLPWAIALLGFVAGRHELKSTWLLIASGFGLLMLGPAGGLHRILYYLYPPLWFTRHTHGFVLFFLFAFLYFYVLGFNHIFSSWNTSLFPPDAVRPRGILKRLIDDRLGTRDLHSIIAFILFSGSIVALVYWMTTLHYPQTHYLFLILLFIFVIGWILRRDLGKKGMYASLMLGHIFFVLIFCQNDGLEFLSKSLLLLGLPFGLFLLVKTHEQLRKKCYIVTLLLVVFSASLIRDLNDHLALTSYLYHGQQHPKQAFHVKTDPHEPSLVDHRRSAPLSLFSRTAQSLRYLSLLYRQPYVFSPVMAIDRDPSAPYPPSMDHFAAALSIGRWNSFLLLRNYFEVINSGIPPVALEEMFCVGKSMFQFKQGVVSVADKELAPFLNGIDPEKAVRLLEKCILVNGEDIDASLAEFSIARSECAALTQNSSGTIQQDQQRNVHFSYSVEEYEYDSFRMNVFTDKKGILYWSDGFDNRWHAYVNGQEVSVYRANANFKAIVLPKGTSHIDFVFKHTAFKMALLVFYSTLGLAIGIGLITRYFSNKRILS